jgi:hypothetical protein
VNDGDVDANMSFAIFHWLFEQWHGCEYDHSGMAHVLADHLAYVLGWTPGAADVMNGYGIGSDVANGSFEEVAPFSGYGWRYYTDAGVSRVYDSVEAIDGNYYLRLVNGASSHQPNPAFAGDTYNVTVSMRGAVDGHQVHMTMDFRDQKMWTDPLQSATKTLDLTTGWLEYEMCATAPTGTAKPVYHTRLTFQAPPGSTVDIDNVVMSLIDGGCGDPPDPPDPPDPSCGLPQESCISGSDCCSGNCSKGKPSTRACL